jgi:flagellar biosynthesis/type III secretory pathway chaperone
LGALQYKTPYIHVLETNQEKNLLGKQKKSLLYDTNGLVSTRVRLQNKKIL